MDLIINGITYNVGLATVARTIRKVDKYRVTTEDGKVHREVRATYIDFTLTIGNISDVAYTALIAAVRAADDEMVITLPHDATVPEMYTGVFDSVTDSVTTEDDDGIMWDSLSLFFTGTQPVEAVGP